MRARRLTRAHGRHVRGEHVVEVLAACRSPLGLVMEYVEGACVFDLIHSRQFHYTWGLVARVATGVAEALREVHACGIIHRDIKSLNILVRLAGRVPPCGAG